MLASKLNGLITKYKSLIHDRYLRVYCALTFLTGVSFAQCRLCYLKLTPKFQILDMSAHLYSKLNKINGLQYCINFKQSP